LFSMPCPIRQIHDASDIGTTRRATKQVHLASLTTFTPAIRTINEMHGVSHLEPIDPVTKPRLVRDLVRAWPLVSEGV
jgi:hypothetical protein